MKKSDNLSAEEKKQYCLRMAQALVELRRRLGYTQEELENVCGISRVTLSQIESGRTHMSWMHFVSLMLLFTQNQETKELLYVRGLLDDQLLGVYQRSPGEAPDYNPTVKEDQIYLLARLEQEQDDPDLEDD